MCFSKGLGAPIGSIIVGSKPFIKQTRWMRQAIGGTLRQAGVVTAAAKCAVDLNFGNGPSGEGNILYRTHQIAQRIAKFWASLGEEIEYPLDTNMVWLDLKKAGIEPTELREMARKRGVEAYEGANCGALSDYGRRGSEVGEAID
jgi:threonine aldolase